MTGIPEITGRWWQTILAFFTLVGMTSGGLVYYAKAETSHLIQVELADPIKNLNQNQIEGIRQIWDKLSRTVDSFFFLAKMIVDRQQSIENKIWCDDQDTLNRVKKEAEEMTAQLERLRLERNQK
jgi:hypothetical protein